MFLENAALEILLTRDAYLGGSSETTSETRRNDPVCHVSLERHPVSRLVGTTWEQLGIELACLLGSHASG